MKKEDIKNLSIDDLKSKAAEMEAKMEKMVLNHAITPIENPMTIRHTRREIARVKTELNKKLKASK